MIERGRSLLSEYRTIFLKFFAWGVPRAKHWRQFYEFSGNYRKKCNFLQKKFPFPPGPHNCSPQQGLNAAFVASCFPSSPATRSGAQAPVFSRMPKAKIMQQPKAKKKLKKQNMQHARHTWATQQSKHATNTQGEG